MREGEGRWGHMKEYAECQDLRHSAKYRYAECQDLGHSVFFFLIFITARYCAVGPVDEVAECPLYDTRQLLFSLSVR